MQALQTSDAALLTLVTCCGDRSTPCLPALEETAVPLLTHPAPAPDGRLSSRQSKPIGASEDQPPRQGRVAHGRSDRGCRLASASRREGGEGGAEERDAAAPKADSQRPRAVVDSQRQSQPPKADSQRQRPAIVVAGEAIVYSIGKGPVRPKVAPPHF